MIQVAIKGHADDCNGIDIQFCMHAQNGVTIYRYKVDRNRL